MGAFAATCQRHRFETVWLPRARAEGWPTKVDFADLRRRVERLEARLRSVLEDGDGEWMKEDTGEEEGPRKRCLFWREMMAEVRKRGTKAAAGTGAQFASFEKTQPG
jgi:hypothetical protein